MKVLTITIPVYNTEKYVKRCLDSMLIEEILDDIEVIAVNDGSKDKSLEILNEFKNKFPNTVKVIDKENGGHGSTINAGIKEATGKYFKVIDSDDWVDSKNFVKMVKILKEENVDLIITNYSKEFIYNGFSEKIKWNKLKENKEYIFDKIDLDILNKEYFVMANSTYKTRILREAKLEMLEKTFYVDMQYNIVPIPNINTFKYFNLDIYRYFIGRPDQSMNLNNFVKNRADHEKVLKFLINYYVEKETKLSKNKKEYINLILYYMLNTHYYIYCEYSKKGSKILKNEITAFDYWLKEKDYKLYKKMNRIGQIRYNRKTKFIFVKISPPIFNKTIKLGSKLKKANKRR